MGGFLTEGSRQRVRNCFRSLQVGVIMVAECAS